MVHGGGGSPSQLRGAVSSGGGRQIRSIIRRGGGVHGRLTWPGSEQGQTRGPGVRIDLNGNLYVNDTEDQGDTEEQGDGWDAARWPNSEPQDGNEDPSLFIPDSEDFAIKIDDSFIPETEYEEEMAAEVEVVEEERVAKVEHEEVLMEEDTAKGMKEEQVLKVERPLVKLEHAVAMEEQAAAMVEHATAMVKQATSMMEQAAIMVDKAASLVEKAAGLEQAAMVEPSHEHQAAMVEPSHEHQAAEDPTAMVDNAFVHSMLQVLLPSFY